SENIEWLSILQHHGGITRLLDFTRSFYVALFFAVESSLMDDNDACVWCMSQLKLKERAIELLPQIRPKIHFGRDIINDDGRGTANFLIGHDTDCNAVFPVMPYRLNERMSIQQGIFLFSTNLCASVENNLYSMFDVHIMDTIPLEDIIHAYEDYCVIKLIIPASCHKDILADLNRMNITAASLFPGLDGYARSLRYLLLD